MAMTMTMWLIHIDTIYYHMVYPCLSGIIPHLFHGTKLCIGSAFLRELGLFGEPKKIGFAMICYSMHCSVRRCVAKQWQKRPDEFIQFQTIPNCHKTIYQFCSWIVILPWVVISCLTHRHSILWWDDFYMSGTAMDSSITSGPKMSQEHPRATLGKELQNLSETLLSLKILLYRTHTQHSYIRV